MHEPEVHTRGPGRPRDPAVVARDEAIYQMLVSGPRSRSAIAAASGHSRGTVYLSLIRLRQTGRVRQCLHHGSIVWAVIGTPCP